MTTVKYKKNFLTNVICKIDFDPELSIKNEPPSKFQEKIKKDFPHLVENELNEYKTSFSKNENVIESFRAPLYVFKDSKTKAVKVINLSYKYLIIEFFQYKSFEEFVECVRNVIDVFSELYEISEFSRLGLRYINEIKINKGNPFDWTNLINSSLINATNDFFYNDRSNICRAISQIILDYDHFKMNFNYGLYNSEFPNKISRKDFVLDYDCYTANIEKKDSYEYLNKFHEKINEEFEKSIEEGLRKEMEGENE